MLRKRMYLASGWFTPEQRRSVDEIKELLRKHNADFFSPEDDCPIQIHPGCSTDLKHKVFEEDVRQIDNAEVVIVNTCDMDTGTVFEYGYAYARDKIIIYYNDNPADQAKKRNLMLAMSADYHARNIKELEEVLLYQMHKADVEGEELE